MTSTLIMLELSRVLSQLITGKLLTDEQIYTITRNTVGEYFSNWFPTPVEELEAQRRVELARTHITEASQIIMGLKNDLDGQAQQLNELIKEIQEKKQLAERYTALAATNQETSAALRAEIEETLRKELITQANKGKRLRQVFSFLGWLITLVLGAALGAYFPQLVEAFRGNTGY